MRLKLIDRQVAGTLALLVVLLASAIAVIYVAHLNRHAFNRYQEALAERDRLDIEWGQLLLEQSAQAAHARVEQIARQRLEMKVPATDEIIWVQW